MPFAADPSLHTAPVAAEVRPAEAQMRQFPLPTTLSVESYPLSQHSFNPTSVVRPQPSSVEEHKNITGISNRAPGSTYHVIYINGIQTSAHAAETASVLVKRAFGVEQCETKVIYNPIENIGSSGLKILGSITSSRLGGHAEPECVQQLRIAIKSAIENPSDRLILVGHSQGSLIIQNVIDRLYDEYQKTPEGRAKWARESGRIEVLLYAPLVRTLAPGPEVVGLMNSYDLPVRGLGGTQRIIAATKHYTGWREQQSVRTITYSPKRNSTSDMLVNPYIVHDAIDLILDNTDLNFRILAEDPQTGKTDGTLLAGNLTRSIAQGRRSDAVHYEMIIRGVDTLGSEFATPFLRQLSDTPDRTGKCIGKFVLSGTRLERIEKVSYQRR